MATFRSPYKSVSELAESLGKENEELKEELNKIDNYYCLEIEKIKADYEAYIQNLINENDELKSKALVNPRKISDNQILDIKNLRNKGLSYRAIAKETKLSTCTVSRVLNGYYD